MNHKRSFKNRNLKLQCGQGEIDCNQESHERIEGRARTKQGSKLSMREFLVSETYFSMEENLIDISFLLTACVRFPHAN